MKRKRVKTLWETEAFCGCMIPRYTTIRVRRDESSHAASSRRDPIYCPLCGAKTWVVRGSLRSA